MSREEHEAYFRRVLGDVEEPTAPFGLLNVQGDGTRHRGSRLRVEPALAAASAGARAEVGSECGQCVSRGVGAGGWRELSGREDVVFGTVLFGRMQGGEGASERWDCSSTRCRCGSGSARRESKRACGERTRQLAELMRHEHASLALAQRCSGVPAPAPLFTSLLNYRHSGKWAGRHLRQRSSAGWKAFEGFAEKSGPTIL